MAACAAAATAPARCRAQEAAAPSGFGADIGPCRRRATEAGAWRRDLESDGVRTTVGSASLADQRRDRVRTSTSSLAAGGTRERPRSVLDQAGVRADHDQARR